MSISRRVVAVPNPQHEVDSRAPDQHAFVVLPSGGGGGVCAAGPMDRPHQRQRRAHGLRLRAKMNRIQLGEHRCSSSEAVSVGTGEKVLFRQ